MHPISSRMRQRILAAILLLVLAPSGLLGAPSSTVVPGPSGPTPTLQPGPRRLLLVMIDGLPVGLFERALTEGSLPNIGGLLNSRPSVVTRALSTFPSSTSPSLPEALTGAYAELEQPSAPGAVHAFDRHRRRVVRYFTEPDAWQWPVADLFTAAAAADLPALTVAEGRWSGAQSILTRGAMVRDAVFEFLGFHRFNGDRGPVERLLRRLERSKPPVVTLLVFNSVDLAGHFYGPSSAQARRALVSTDALLGRVLGALSRLPGETGGNLLDETTVLLFGDHGMVDSGTFIRLQPVFQRRGLSVFDAASVPQLAFRERLGSLWSQWPDVLLVAGGSNVTQVYFREKTGAWEEGLRGRPGKARKLQRLPPAEILIDTILAVPGVSQVLRPLDDARVEIRASDGRRAVVVRRESGGSQSFAYVVGAGAFRDPLEYLADTRIAPWVCFEDRLQSSCFHSREAWQRRTVDARYPGAVGLLHKALRPPRFTGDMVITALPGFTFLKGQHGDHGNLERDAMTTPFVLSGPGVTPALDCSFVRLVDLFPTAAVLLGADPRDPSLSNLDGRPLPCARPPLPVTSP